MGILLCFLFFFLMIRRPPRSTLFSLHDALPIYFDIFDQAEAEQRSALGSAFRPFTDCAAVSAASAHRHRPRRSEEHTSELQSRLHLVCRLLLEKKNTAIASEHSSPHKCVPYT